MLCKSPPPFHHSTLDIKNKAPLTEYPRSGGGRRAPAYMKRNLPLQKSHFPCIAKSPNKKIQFNSAGQTVQLNKMPFCTIATPKSNYTKHNFILYNSGYAHAPLFTSLKNSAVHKAVISRPSPFLFLGRFSFPRLEVQSLFPLLRFSAFVIVAKVTEHFNSLFIATKLDIILNFHQNFFSNGNTVFILGRHDNHLKNQIIIYGKTNPPPMSVKGPCDISKKATP